MSEREDIERVFTEMFSVNGLPLSAQLSPDDRRERIRAVIIEQKLKDRPYDAHMSYAEAYRICYLRSIALQCSALGPSRP